MHQEGIKIMNPSSIHIFYLHAPNNIALKIKQKMERKPRRNEKILYHSGR